MFGKDLGDDATMTAGNSTPLTDGASAVLLGSDEWAAEHGLPVLAHVVDAQTAAVDYVHGGEGLLMAPSYAVPKMLERQGLTLQDFDFYEIHEAFASTVLATLKAWDDEDFCRDRLGLDEAARLHRPHEAERQRLEPRGRPPVRRHRRPDRREPGEVAAREGLRTRAHLDLRRRRPGRRRDPGGCHVSPTHADGYTSFVRSGFGKALSARLGLPQPVPLRRYTPGDALLDGPALVASAGRTSPFDAQVGAVLSDALVEVLTEVPSDRRLSAVVVDVSGARTVADLEELRAVLAPALKRLGRCGRVVLVGRAPETLEEPEAAATQRALEGITRSVAKELRQGATANTRLHPRRRRRDRRPRCGSSSPAGRPTSTARSSGSARPSAAGHRRQRPLQGKVAVVTGAARGIGAAIADVLARDGATVIAVDVPAAGEPLAAVANRVGGTALQVDVTAPDAGAGSPTTPTPGTAAWT